ncbi:ABC transporter permease [Nicoliella spurrieriana]|uniref:Putative hemin transport system permease protein HrtB n=1 Tax=Nicoliella spurrieriana TaxID=2925830 RepID=A0A976X5N4_9LACO|nr:ABC transporter permease [Nicoliella spurrieriana]UQS87118.1 ABC transporter permease [Nicoliella spurrieriana]
MFLGLREVKKYKLRYGLITFVLLLIAYLIFVLTGLANGLSSSNRLAIDSWDAQQIVLNDDANGSLTQSNLTSNQVAHFKGVNDESTLVQLNANVAKNKNGAKLGVQVLGINMDQPIYRNLKVESGHRFANDHQIVVDDSLIKANGYHVGEWIRIANHTKKFQIVGMTKNAKLSVAPVIYGSTKMVQKLKFGKQTPTVSAIVLKHHFSGVAASGTQVMRMDQFINKLPGYTAQNNTFNFMIGFLLVITLFIVAIFLYVLTIQKIPFLAVMKVQGISNWYLFKSIVGQALALAITGIVISGALTFMTALSIPTSVPIQFNLGLLGLISLLMVIITILGAIIPMRTVAKIDPATVIGG